MWRRAGVGVNILVVSREWINRVVESCPTDMFPHVCAE